MPDLNIGPYKTLNGLDAYVTGITVKASGVKYLVGFIHLSSTFICPALWNKDGKLCPPYPSQLRAYEHSIDAVHPGKKLYDKVSPTTGERALLQQIVASNLVVVPELLKVLFPISLRDKDPADLIDYVRKEIL